MAAKKITVDLFYDHISAYSWLALEQLTRHLNVWPTVTLRLRPFLIAGIMKGSENKPPMLVANKAVYMTNDLDRVGKYLGVPMKVPSNFFDLIAKGTLKAMRFTTAIDMTSNGKHTEAISREMFKRVYSTHKAIGELDNFREAGKDAGLTCCDVEKAIIAMETDEVKNRLRANTDEALTYGAFGAPTIVAHLESGPQMFFGNDRIELLANELGVPYKGPLLQFSKL